MSGDDLDTGVGQSTHGTERPPFIDPQTDWVECYLCGQIIEDFSRVEGMDISEPDEYYPKMVPVCPTHDTGGESA